MVSPPHGYLAFGVIQLRQLATIYINEVERDGKRMDKVRLARFEKNPEE
ncbi:MAG TPA: hypothetical protein VMR88_17920 [Candidatus Polarisedimenticolaceae bacterium]|nr:hypothetical protein [Candidatus Polarisedimenticolaceae bacterium]